MDRYRVLKKIGTGTYGSAYLVSVYNHPNEVFVLKKVKINEEGGEKERSAVENEVRRRRGACMPAAGTQRACVHRTLHDYFLS